MAYFKAYDLMLVKWKLTK